MKVKVKILEPIAGLADPKPMADLDRKYEKKIAEMNRGREKELSKYFTDNLLAEWRKRDRYAEKPLGFPRDYAFKVGDEPMIDETLAKHWEDAGICMIVTEPSSKKAA